MAGASGRHAEQNSETTHPGPATTGDGFTVEASERQLGVKRFLLPIIIPGLLQGKAQTLVTPMLPIFVKVDLGGTDSVVGAITSAYALSQFFSSAPLGLLMKNLDYSFAACLSLGVLGATALLSSTVKSAIVLFAIRLVGGVCVSAFDISRKAYMSSEVPHTMRGRVSALLASMQKWAVMIAAALSGVIAQTFETRSVFVFQAILSSCALLLIALHDFHFRPAQCRNVSAATSSEGVAGDAGGTRRSNTEPRVSHSNASLVSVVRCHWRSLLGAGGYCAMLSGIRNTWIMALPLQGHNIGLSRVNIGITVAVSRGFDATVTLIVAGHVMDKYGLKAAAVPSMLIMASAYILLICASSPISLGIAGVVYGIGNGICGGILNAFATSRAPPEARTQFLGLWKMVTALGGISLPPLFGLISDVGSVETAGIGVASMAVLSVLWLLLMVQENTAARGTVHEAQGAVLLSSAQNHQGTACSGSSQASVL